MSQDTADALERLRTLLGGEAPADGGVFLRLVHTLVRRAGPEGERLFGQRLVREPDARKALELVEAAVGILGVGSVTFLRDTAARWSDDGPRVQAVAAVLGRLATPEAYQALAGIEARAGGPTRDAAAAARRRIEQSHPTRYSILPRLKALDQAPEEAERCREELLATNDDELGPLLLDAWDSLPLPARRVMLTVMERRGDGLAGHLFQGEIETESSGELLLPLCAALRGILQRHPEAAEGYESLWQRVWADPSSGPEELGTAAVALAANPDAELLPLYRQFLQSPIEEARVAGLRALASVPDRTAHGDLVRSLGSASEEEMAAALEALTALGDDETLEQWARTSDPTRRRGVARICLKALRPDLWASLAADADQTVAESALDAWGRAPRGSRPGSRTVVSLLARSRAEAVFQRTCRILASIGEADALPALTRYLKGSGAARLSAIRTLKALRVRQVYTWKDLSNAMRTSILSALESSADSDVMSFLSTLAMDLPPDVLARVRAILEKGGDAPRPEEADAKAQEVAEVIYANLLEKIDARERREFVAREVERLLQARSSRPGEMAGVVRRVAELWARPGLGIEGELFHRVEGFLTEVTQDKTAAPLARRDAIAAMGKRGSPEALLTVMRLRNHPVEVLAEAARESVETFARRNPGANLAHAMSRQSSRAQVVLVAEDDPEVRSLYQSFLYQNGFTTVGVSDGEEALWALDGRMVGLILLDLDMPRLSGFDVLAELKTRPARPPVLVVTGHTDQSSVVRARGLGAAEILRKPVDLLDLLDRVRRAAPWDLSAHPLPPAELSASQRGRALRATGQAQPRPRPPAAFE